MATTANAIDPVSNTLLVELKADNPVGVLSPGTFTNVHFDLPPQPDVVRIPTSALLFREGGLKVATVGPDGKAEIRPIRAGRDLGTQMEVLGGLAPSDRVIDSPPDSLLAGETVREAGANAAHDARHGPQMIRQGLLAGSLLALAGCSLAPPYTPPTVPAIPAELQGGGAVAVGAPRRHAAARPVVDRL